MKSKDTNKDQPERMVHLVLYTCFKNGEVFRGYFGFKPVGSERTQDHSQPGENYAGDYDGFHSGDDF
jgi:hypothetical protein